VLFLKASFCSHLYQFCPLQGKQHELQICWVFHLFSWHLHPPIQFDLEWSYFITQMRNIQFSEHSKHACLCACHLGCTKFLTTFSIFSLKKFTSSCKFCACFETFPLYNQLTSDRSSNFADASSILKYSLLKTLKLKSTGFTNWQWIRFVSNMRRFYYSQPTTAKGLYNLCQHHFELQFLSKPETQNYVPTQTGLHQHNIHTSFPTECYVLHISCSCSFQGLIKLNLFLYHHTSCKWESDINLRLIKLFREQITYTVFYFTNYLW